MHTGRKTTGSSTLEFTLVGIPLIFILISTFEVARIMWMYDTLGYAAREATRYAVVHGENCATPPNTCAVKVSNIAAKIQFAAVGLDPALLTVTLSGSAASTIGPATLATCLTNSTYWPVAGAGIPGSGAGVDQTLDVALSYPFDSAIAMFAPGTPAIVFGRKTLAASSREKIQF
jgi:Flp pilus assembly protein TadG